jgi:hypothetical protein
MSRLSYLLIVLSAALALSACTTAQPDQCAVNLRGNLNTAMNTAESKLASGCEYHFNSYFNSLLTIAEQTPDSDNKMLFSDHLMRVNDMGVISRRQAKDLYNRYFNIKFVIFKYS